MAEPQTDNLDEIYIFRHQNAVKERMRRAFQGLDDAPEQAEEPEITGPLGAPSLEPEPTVQHEHSIARRIGADALQVLGGAGDAFVETMQLLDGLLPQAQQAGIADMPIPKAETPEGDVIRSLSQFITGMIPAMKGVRALGMTGKITAPMAAGAIADFAAFDPNEPRIANLINDLAPALRNPLTEYLAAQPDDTEAEGRLKNAVEGVVSGVMADTAFRLFRALKSGAITRGQAARELARASRRAQRRTAAQAAREEAVEETLDIPQALEDLTDEQIARAVAVEADDAATRRLEGITRTEDLLARVEAGDEEAIKEGLKRASVTRAKDGSLAVRRGKRLVRFDTEQEAADDILTRRLERQMEAGDPFDPQRALRLALGLGDDVDLPEGLDPDMLARVAERRVSQALVEVTDIGREQATQFLTREASGEGASLLEEGKRLRVNFDQIKGPDDLKKTIALTADILRDAADEQARGRQTIEDMLARSRKSRFQNVANILGLEEGAALNPEDALAVRQVWTSSANRLHTLSRQVAEGDLDKAEDFLRQFVLHANIHTQATGVRAEAGRTLRVFGVEMPATNRRFMAEIGRALESSNGVTPQRLAQMVASIPSQEQLAKFVVDAEKATVGDALLEVWINSLLSGPQTQVANILGNSLTTLWSIPERQLASALGGGIQTGEAAQMAYGMKQGFLDGFKLFRESFRTGQPVFDPSGKLELRTQTRAFRGETFGAQGGLATAIDRAGDVLTIPGRTLLAFDEFFKGLNYRMELHAQAFRQAGEEGLTGQEAASRIAEILDDPPETVIDAARNFARYNTFTSDLGQEGMAFERLGRATERVSEATNELPVLKLMLPFVRTPFNIARYAAERTPLGLFSRSVWQQLTSQGPEAAMARSKLLMGSMVLGVATLMAGEGMISGRGPSDPRLRKFKQDNDNWQPYSIRVGDRWVSYNRLEPLGSLFGMVADFAQMSGEVDQLTSDRVSGMILMSVWQNLSSKTYMRGLSEAIGTLAPQNWADAEQAVKPGARFFEQLAGTVVPTFAAQLNRAHFDNTLRQTTGAMDRICSRIPGCSQTLEPRLNIWAEPIELPKGLGYSFISPLYTTLREPDAVDNEIVRLKIPLTMPPKSFGSDVGGGDPIELTPQQHNELIALQAGIGLTDSSGKRVPLLKDSMQRLMNSRSYARMPDTMKALALRGLIYHPQRGYRALARAAFELRHPELRQRLVKKKLGPKIGLLPPRQQRVVEDAILQSIGATP